ncbi:hypothetical protein ACOMHN_065918 [Nucella lapillus]
MEAPFGLTDSLLDGNPTTQPDTTFPAQNTTNNTGCVELSEARINPCENSDGLVSMATRQLGWICVTWPLQAARVLSTRKTCVVIVVFSVIFLAGNQLAAFKYDVVCAYVKGAESITFLYILPSTLYRRHPVLMETVDSFGFSSMVPTLSILITATATALTAVRIRRAAQWRDS